MWTSQGYSQVCRKPEGQVSPLPASWYPEYQSVACIQSTSYPSLGLAILGSDAKLPGGQREALAAQREHPVVVTPADAFSPDHSDGAVFLTAWPLLSPA